MSCGNKIVSNCFKHFWSSLQKTDFIISPNLKKLFWYLQISRAFRTLEIIREQSLQGVTDALQVIEASSMSWADAGVRVHAQLR